MPLIDDLKKKKVVGIREFAEELENLTSVDLDFQNFKVQSVVTDGNQRVINPPHDINIKCENFWIIGDVGRGKTTFFDKFYHFFCFREDINSPIQGLKTNITIELKNEESLKLNFTRLEKKRTIIRLDDLNESDSLDILKKKGIIDNYILKLNFIPETEDNDAIYNSDLNLTSFFELNKIFFLDNRDNLVLRRFSDIIKEQNELFRNILTQEFQLNHTILNLYRGIEKNEELLKNFQSFITNFNKIRDYINNLKVDNKLRELYTNKKKIQEKIFEQESKIKKFNQIKKFEDNYPSKKKGDKAFIKYLYINYEPLCPICSNIISMDSFQKRYNSDKCYLCGDSPYDYIEKEETIHAEDTVDESKIMDLKSLQYFLNNKKYELIKEKEKIEKNIKEYKQFTQPIDNEFKKIINQNYLDLTRPGFSIGEELNRKKELKNHYSELINSQKEILKDHEEKIDFLQHKKESLNKKIKILEKSYQTLKDKLNVKIKNIFKNFIKDLRSLWTKLTDEPLKTIVYDRNDDLLKIGAVSTSGNRFLFNLKSLKLKKEERHFSHSQSNALRFAIHFSLIKNLFERYKKFPLKTIFIDAPPSGIKERLYKIIKEDFVNKLDFQFIIFSKEKEEPFLDWNEKEFLPYESGFFKIKSREGQKLISEFW
ncbi:hypothetical protein LCGC14_0474040 [marine sediment metagenome]|uniref:Uncharacterized protein n=1 Tax=marine sediment metagenome TaxID=412755 RepID=A0A0F9SGL4_9ZZZZ|nr:hypothetical protein [bacterium]